MKDRAAALPQAQRLEPFVGFPFKSAGQLAFTSIICVTDRAREKLYTEALDGARRVNYLALCGKITMKREAGGAHV